MDVKSQDTEGKHIANSATLFAVFTWPNSLTYLSCGFPVSAVGINNFLVVVRINENLCEALSAGLGT